MTNIIKRLEFLAPAIFEEAIGYKGDADWLGINLESQINQTICDDGKGVRIKCHEFWSVMCDWIISVIPRSIPALFTSIIIHTLNRCTNMAKDKLHDIVEIALAKDGWMNIQPLTLDYDGTELNLDIIADKLIAAEQGNLKIAVEVKSFGNPSVTYDFHQAVGQYLHYRMALSHIGIGRTLYLAIPDAIYTNYLTQPFFQDSLALHRVNLVTIDPLHQETVRWKPNPL